MDNWNENNLLESGPNIQEHFWREMVTVETETNSRGTNVRIKVNAQTPERTAELYRETKRRIAEQA
jgi:hypothetical protein